MDWPEALEIVVGRTGHERYRVLTAESHPDHEAWRRRMVAEATGQPAAAVAVPASYPPLKTQIKTAMRAVAAAATAALKRKAVFRSAKEEAACLAICRECEYFVAAEERCSVCGCVMAFKARLASEHCPLSEPKW